MALAMEADLLVGCHYWLCPAVSARPSACTFVTANYSKANWRGTAEVA